MKQILQHLKTGTMELAELPAPAVTRGLVLIQTMRSLISAGTERMLVEFSKGNLIQKACSRKRGGQFAVSDSLHACRPASLRLLLPTDTPRIIESTLALGAIEHARID